LSAIEGLLHPTLYVEAEGHIFDNFPPDTKFSYLYLTNPEAYTKEFDHKMGFTRGQPVPQILIKLESFSYYQYSSMIAHKENYK
jgi:hypothetical protein